MPNTPMFPSPQSIRVTDQKSFRAWCHAMYLTPTQAAALTGRSKEFVYKKLDLSHHETLNETVLAVCNLYSEVPAERRAELVRERLLEKGNREPWPAQVPIH